AYIGGNGSFVIVTGPALNQGTIFTCIGMYPCSLYACLISSVCGMQVFLPVEWASFTATPFEKSCQLQWSTASEVNADFFEVQRSSDGITFEQVGIVRANGTTSELHQYGFEDRNLSSGTYYYRIRQSDFDGKFSYSLTEAVDIHSRNGLSVVPNPVSGHRFRIGLDRKSDTSSRIVLFDTYGRSVFETTLAVGTALADVELPMCIAAGSYLLMVDDGLSPGFEHMVVEP
ncbi:MAG: hypothetical protein RL021_332, partial [Bacteroidota bacterium]